MQWMTTQYTSDMPKVRWLSCTALRMPVTKQGVIRASGKADRPVVECDIYEGLDLGNLRIDWMNETAFTDNYRFVRLCSYSPMSGTTTYKWYQFCTEGIRASQSAFDFGYAVDRQERTTCFLEGLACTAFLMRSPV
jgi:hypothetical protein